MRWHPVLLSQQRDFFTDILAKVLGVDAVRTELLVHRDGVVANKAAASSEPTSSLSIAQIRASRRQEKVNKKYADNWNREKDAFLKESERATRARIKSDSVLRKQRKIVVEPESQDRDPKVAEAINVAEIPVSIDNKKKEDFETHPILGRCLADLGYKRLHLTLVENLFHIPVWEKQRIYRDERAIQMAKDKRKTPHLGLPGIIVMHENTTTGDLCILDGQHRVGMLAILNEQDDGPEHLKDKPVVVEVYPSAEANYAKELFTEINRAESVQLVDMPGVMKDSSRQILNDAAASMKQLYPEMFKPSQRCRPPHLNIDNLRQALFVASVLDRHSIKNAAALVDWMTAQNDRLKEEYKEESVRSKAPDKVMEKADANQFYLGLESTWYTK